MQCANSSKSTNFALFGNILKKKIIEYLEYLVQSEHRFNLKNVTV